MALRLPSSSLVQVGGKQERFLLAFGIPRNNSNGTQHGMNPGNEAQTPIGSIQTDDTGTDLVKTYGSC